MTATASLTYLRFELLRALRNTRFFLFSLAFPLILFFVVAGSQRHNTLGGIPFATYYMAGMVSWGTMAAVVGSGARISAERAAGWNRQLRLTPLTARAYLRAKVLGGYLVALMSIALLYLAGISLGVRLPADRWLEMTWLVLVGLIPFAALGILFGHLLTVDSVGPTMGGVTALLSILGGVWFPIQNHQLQAVAKALPSYWLVQAAHLAIGGNGWGATGWIIVTAWSVALAAGAMWAYRRDTGRT
jgi:ABC-2 type transport system permease protein